MAYPAPETGAAQSIKTPDDFDRESFRVVIAEAHIFFQTELWRTVCFRAPHASGKMHLNVLVRAKRPSHSPSGTSIRTAD